MTGIGNCPECDAEIGMKANRCRYCGALSLNGEKEGPGGRDVRGSLGK